MQLSSAFFCVSVPGKLASHSALVSCLARFLVGRSLMSAVVALAGGDVGALGSIEVIADGTNGKRIAAGRKLRCREAELAGAVADDRDGRRRALALGADDHAFHGPVGSGADLTGQRHRRLRLRGTERAVQPSSRQRAKVSKRLRGCIERLLDGRPVAFTRTLWRASLDPPVLTIKKSARRNQFGSVQRTTSSLGEAVAHKSICKTSACSERALTPDEFDPRCQERSARPRPRRVILKTCEEGLELEQLVHRRRRLVTATRTEMAGATGLEPATFGVTGRRSNQLSYAPAGVVGVKYPLCASQGKSSVPPKGNIHGQIRGFALPPHCLRARHWLISNNRH